MNKSENKSGSLCPAVKASAIIGDKWVLLILRELFLGAHRYNDFQKAIARISPTVLSGRLKDMETAGLLIKRTVSGKKGGEYRLTKSGRELGPIIDHLSRWGLRWTRRSLKDEDIDVAGFMWDFHRSLNLDELPDGKTVLSVQFPEQETYKKWWLIIENGTVDLCTEDPGFDIDIYIVSSLISMVSVWMGDSTLKEELASQAMTLTGDHYLMKTAARWFALSRYSDVRPVSSLK
ncbi:helix-turn-helix domain-containing protein [Temperatibacter marinus]|uniref:Helix-turn-helix domain-containing protein n=1 Tax=Temperatibacter marinus TaxID=1456591 RepID=A0AA52H9P0_9PROT|nr:helix-turn-helix domain-containing protein [Temperatibacter marinus]WND01808.1 helix-turn-helix domain-containing protein [Temperatibacter marinus]